MHDVGPFLAHQPPQPHLHRRIIDVGDVPELAPRRGARDAIVRPVKIRNRQIDGFDASNAAYALSILGDGARHDDVVAQRGERLGKILNRQFRAARTFGA